MAGPYWWLQGGQRAGGGQSSKMNQTARFLNRHFIIKNHQISTVNK
jgi:hypothetical protein